jgi:hypothetical protein
MDKSSTSSRSPDNVESEPVAKKARMVHKTIIYDESIANQWLDEPPLEVWDHKIIPLLSLRDLALSRTVCTFFEAYWQDKFSNNVLPLRVGNDVATINDVMGVIEILSSRREYTKLNPFVVLLGKGEYQVTSTWTSPNDGNRATTLGIARSNITFLGSGKDTTTILGGFGIENQKNITFKHMTVTNTSDGGVGIYMQNVEEVEMVNVAIKNCQDEGLYMTSSEQLKDKEQVVLTRCQLVENDMGVHATGDANIKMTDCVIKSNEDTGIFAFDSTVNLHGEATGIHSNVGNGIFSWTAKVIIHLPSHHNTCYNNGDQDRSTDDGGTITNVED